MSFLLAAIIALLAIILPGFTLAFALLRKTKLNTFEIAVIGFLFGLLFPPTMIWLESYLIGISSIFAFSAALYNANVLILTAIGILLLFWQGAITPDHIRPLLGMKRQSISNLEKAVEQSHESGVPLSGLSQKHSTHSKYGNVWIWYILVALIAIAFLTRIASIGISPVFFEFDPYFDMLSTQSILVHGFQVLYDHSAWPTLAAGSPHRIEPIIPYLEAYWYSLSTTNLNTFSTTLMSIVSSFYPPITAALLVFVVFMFLRHEYGEFPAIIGAALATAMPALISTFIAGEQLVEPIGILTLFFFYAAYLLAVNNMKDKRFAVLAGIAFVSTFLGAHYYTVDAGVLAIYILLQGTVFVFRRENLIDFYKMNAIVIAIIAVFYEIFAPYGSVLTNRTPELLHLPIIFGFPLFALLFVVVLDQVPKLLSSRKVVFSEQNTASYLVWFAVMVIVALLLITFTSLGEPVHKYIQLSTHFTTPSIPLFATVQEYAPTGLNYDFGAAGFGIIGASIFHINIIVWLVMILFTILMLLAVIYRNSKFGILSLAAVWPLAIAGMLEVKYLPHFGVGYILAIGAIIGELLIIVNSVEKSRVKVSSGPSGTSISFFESIKVTGISNAIPNLDLTNRSVQIIAAIAIIAVVFESSVYVSIISAAINPNCSTLASGGNSVGYTLYCQTIDQSWLKATAWMKANVGPFAPRILSWWDYGDWINWFGNSNAVLRGDNAVATSDYATAAQYVLTKPDGYTPQTLANYMNGIQAQYVLFDDQLMPKWGALDFLACVNANETSLSYAEQQGQQHGAPYLLGGSQCEQAHSPAYALIPTSTQNINDYCQFKNTSAQALKVLVITGTSELNTTFCAPISLYTGTPNAVHLLTINDTQTNIVVIPTTSFFYGTTLVNNEQYGEFMLVYLPNGPNETITNAPTAFYNSSYYKGFFFGKLPGYTLVYPTNFTGVNYVTAGANPVMILKLNNYTGGTPPVTPKASYVHNNYTMPG
ncbi:MAG: hypothetical protein KGH78_00600 [Candidatus Micrarchaeota archaeon]|nr:hypothetical protein [Candidatus Micrarchaeota archaeon]